MRRWSPLGRCQSEAFHPPERDVTLHARKTRRRCLRCDASFDSSGPGNRLCNRCRFYAAESSPFEPQ